MCSSDLHVASENGAVYLTNMGSNFYTKVRSVDMGDGADSIIICTKGNAGKLEVHAGSEKGAVLASIDVPSSSKWEEHTFALTDAAGVDDLFFVVKQGGFDFDYWYMVSNASAVPQTPYNDVAAAVPGKVEAENYDVGGHNKAFYDNDRENQGEAYRQDEVDIVAIDDSKCGDAACTGFAIGYTQDDEWVEYTINVAADASYKITANVATASETSAFQLFVDDKAITESIAVPQVDTTWNVYKEIDVGSVELTKGEHVLKLLITGGYLNVDWLQFTDPNAGPALAIKAPLVDVAKSRNYEVFSVSGKRLGRVNVASGTIAESLKMAGYRPGIYMVRNASDVHVVNTAK